MKYNESWDSEVRKGLQHVVARKTHPRGYITLQLEECRKCVDIAVLRSLHPGMDRFRRHILNVVGWDAVR
jgi:hypothetical protein